MTGVLRRYFADHRLLLTVLAAVAVGNLLFQLAVLSPLDLRMKGIRATHDAGQVAAAAAFKEYAGVLLEIEALESARDRVERLRSDILQLKPVRFPIVDAKLRELQDRFGGTAQAVVFNYGELPIGQLEQFAVTFQLKGSYQTLREFVSAVEVAEDDAGSDLFFAMESIGLEDSTASGRELNLKVRLVTYFYAPEIGQPLRGPIRPGRETATGRRRSSSSRSRERA